MNENILDKKTNLLFIETHTFVVINFVRYHKM